MEEGKGVGEVGPVEVGEAEDGGALVLAVGFDPGDEGAEAFFVDGAVGFDDVPHGVDEGGALGLGWGGADSEFGEERDGGFADVEEVDVFVFAAGVEEDDGKTFAACSTGAACSVEEGFWVGGGIHLDDEVDLWDVETSSGKICCDKNRG